MNEINSERSGCLRLSLIAAVTKVCRQKLHFVDFVQITGCLTFRIDNAEKLDVVILEVVGAIPTTSVPASVDQGVLPTSVTQPGTSKKQRRVRRIKCSSDEEVVVVDEVKTKEPNDAVKPQDEAANDLQELEKVGELLESVPIKDEVGSCSGPTITIEPVFENLSLQTVPPSKDVDNVPTTENKTCDISKKRYSCDICDFVTVDVGQYHGHMRRHKGVVSSHTCSSCDKSFNSATELKHHVAQVHPRFIKCPQCPEQFPTSCKVKSHLKVVHGVNEDLVSCQSCRKRFITLELLQEHTRAKHEKLCVICNATFTDRNKLATHRCTEHADTDLRCVLCDRRCPTKGALRKHMFDHRDPKQYKCDECEKCFTSGSTLYHHKRAMHGDSKPYQCKICGSSFNFRNSMKLHMLRHDGERPYKCTICDKSYLTSSHLKFHVRAVHEESKPFPCAICGKTFPYENSLRLHKRLHTGERPFTCSFCGKSFVARSALRTHEETHTENVLYACDVCHKSYKTPSLLRAHRRRHTSDGERFICDVCGQRFMYRSNLEAHCSIHSDARQHACSTCGSRFKTYAAMHSHRQVHVPSSPFVCTKCGKSFKTKERLRVHESRHLGQKPFTCLLCNNAFPDKGGLAKHIKSVHAAKPMFACPVCGKTCNRADNLRVHMKVHGKPELLKLSLQDLAVTESSELPTLRTKKSVLHPATTVVAPPESAPLHDVEALSSNTSGSPLNRLGYSGNDYSYNQNVLGLFAGGVAGGNEFDARFMQASRTLNNGVLGVRQRNLLPTVPSYDISLGFGNRLDRTENK